MSSAMADPFFLGKFEPGIMPEKWRLATRCREHFAGFLRRGHHAQIVPRGTGTGLAGGCVAFDNGVVVSTVKLNKILTIDLENRVAHVQAGVRNTALSDAVAQLPLEVESSLSAQEPPATSSPS